MAWRLRFSLANPLDLSLCPTFKSTSLPLSLLHQRVRYIPPFLARYTRLPLARLRSLPLRSVLLVVPSLVTTFLPTVPPTPRLRDDVNSHAHVFELPHHAHGLHSLISTAAPQFLTSKANAFHPSGEPMINLLFARFNFCMCMYMYLGICVFLFTFLSDYFFKIYIAKIVFY